MLTTGGTSSITRIDARHIVPNTGRRDCSRVRICSTGTTLIAAAYAVNDSGRASEVLSIVERTQCPGTGLEKVGGSIHGLTIVIGCSGKSALRVFVEMTVGRVSKCRLASPMEGGIY